MRRTILAAFLLLMASTAWATCTVTSVYVESGGSYSDSEAPSITFTGPGVGGADAIVYMVRGGIKYHISSILVTNSGSYTGPVTITFSGGFQELAPITYVVMGGSCATGGGKRVYSWLF
jgi:hypothetical protein